MHTLYIIAGCNGAGKTTASKTLLPDVLNCREFVNADAIAAGLSPFNPESVAIQAGKLMLERIDFLLNQKSTFAIETTLSTKSYVGLAKKAQTLGYEVVLVYFWLNSVELAIQRVADRVSKGGHSIPEDVIRRRYKRGIENLKNLFLPVVDECLIFDNTTEKPISIAHKIKGEEIIIVNQDLFIKFSKTDEFS